MSDDQTQAIHWLEDARRAIERSVPQAAEAAPLIAGRLSELLLARLPAELAREMLDLLPEDASRGRLGEPMRGLAAHRRRDARLGPDRSIGHTAFVALTRHLMGLTELLDSPEYAESEEAYCRLCEQATAEFLWAVAHDLPVELKARIAEHLPSDLKSRMNLYSGFSHAEKVA
jgi:hypothetical protein